MTIRLNVTDRDGVEHQEQVQVQPQGTLMEALRELDYGVTAVCGGMCSCATCHVYVDSIWGTKLPQQQGDERELIQELVDKRENSRLSCQIPLTAALDGLKLTLAPEE